MKEKEILIHDFFLNKSKKLPFLRSIFISNGLLKIKVSELGLFPFICQTIISQQISFKAANSIWDSINDMRKLDGNNFENFFKKKTNKTNIMKAGVSKKKLNYMINIFNALKKGFLVEKNLKKMNQNSFKKIMKSYSGIGEWSCNMIEIFYFGKENIWPINDLIIEKMCNIINENEKKKINFTKKFHPYLSFLSLHLWKANNSKKKL